MADERAGVTRLTAIGLGDCYKRYYSTVSQHDYNEVTGVLTVTAAYHHSSLLFTVYRRTFNEPLPTV